MKKRTVRQLVLGTILTILVFSPVMLTSLRGQSPTGGFPDLVAGLKAVPGCLGVEATQTSSGKQVLFAWFENKTAALAWYNSAMHQSIMHRVFPGAPAHTPMADVPDDGSPILAIASLTPAAPVPGAAKGAPFSQIAIELYRPLPGGISLGGRFAPAALKVPGIREIPWSVFAGTNQQ